MPGFAIPVEDIGLLGDQFQHELDIARFFGVSRLMRLERIRDSRQRGRWAWHWRYRRPFKVATNSAP